MNKVFMKEEVIHLSLLIIVILVSIWSVINPLDYTIWLANFMVAFIYLIGFIITYKKFRFTTFSYILIFIHLIIILIAAKYTYENNPLFSFIQDRLGSSRNNFDRIGHILQGFIPVILTREIFLRKGYMEKSKVFYLVIIFFVLGISASWELLEFFAATIFNKTDAYLISSQGDIWDAQWDMLCAIIGSLMSLLIFSKYHDKKIEELNKTL